MDAETRKEINNLKAAMRAAASAFRQIELYLDGTKKPSRQGLQRLNNYLDDIDKAVPGGGRGSMTP